MAAAPGRILESVRLARFFATFATLFAFSFASRAADGAEPMHNQLEPIWLRKA